MYWCWLTLFIIKPSVGLKGKKAGTWFDGRRKEARRQESKEAGARSQVRLHVMMTNINVSLFLSFIISMVIAIWPLVTTTPSDLGKISCYRDIYYGLATHESTNSFTTLQKMLLALEEVVRLPWSHLQDVPAVEATSGKAICSNQHLLWGGGLYEDLVFFLQN